MDRVLDVGVGEGAFVLAAYDRLRELGAHAADAQSQLYGTEIDQSTYSRFQERAQELDASFPNVRPGDFFDVDLPPSVDALVGNPPYVRRTYIEDIGRIRQSVVASNRAIDEADLPRLTDLSIYFLLRGLAVLEPEGKLAVVTTDSWLNANYGKVFKEYLLQNFEIEYLISLDRRVFDDAQVKPVLVLGTKRRHQNNHTHFVRIKNGLPIYAVQEFLVQPNAESDDVSRFSIRSGDLKASKPWGIHFKAPELYAELALHPLTTPIASLANTRIGIQTLAKDFFVLTAEQAELAQIEREYLEPLAQSPRHHSEPIIEKGTQPSFYVFYCSKSKEELQGTRALEYIAKGESTEVEVRGKGTTVIGYQNKRRIQESSRNSWYNLRTSLERRGRAAILIPRLTYRTFTVVWNKASFVPGELFIEFLPLPLDEISIEVYLAVLASSVSEIMLRAHAQVYGGGTYNIKPGQIKKVPILNVSLLTAEQKGQLEQAYVQYLKSGTHDRTVIDDVVCQILGFEEKQRRRTDEVLQDLLQIATDSKKPA
jgi:tRNA1(Val) A37 N6-methylase TrmN6